LLQYRTTEECKAGNLHFTDENQRLIRTLGLTMSRLSLAQQ